MNVIIFGANGRIGKLVVDKLLSNGHNVQAMVRGGSSFKENKSLSIIQADIYNPSTYSHYVKGCDVVVSTLGSWGTEHQDIVSTGIKHILPAMEKYGVRRIVTLTGADARAKGDKLDFLHKLNRWALMLVAKKIILDGDNHILQLENSDVDWVVLRSPIMRDSSKAGFILNNKRPRPWESISRQNVADAMVRVIENDDLFRKSSPYIHNK